MKTYQIVFSKPTKNGNFFTKIQFKGQTTTSMGAFGQNVSQKQETYFVFGNTQMQAGQTIQINPAQYSQTTKPYTIPSTGETIDLKYLTAYIG